MKLSKSRTEIILFLAVWLFALWLWTLPLQAEPIPYGEWDAISHWEIADYMAMEDRSFSALPPFIDYSYNDDNRYRPGTLWYHPPFHTDLAIISSFANERIVTIYLTNAIFASAILLAVFFVIRSLFGFFPAILSAAVLSVSLRDILPFLWGQWPERFAYSFIPLILYCIYRYWTTYKESPRPIYLILASILGGVNLFMHPLVLFHTAVATAILLILLAIKDRSINIKPLHLIAPILIFALLFAAFPLQSGNVLSSLARESADDSQSAAAPKHPLLSRLISWSPPAEDFRGSVPAEYFSFAKMHGYWLLPLLLIGIAALAMRRESRDLFMLAWLIGLYIILHRDVLGNVTFLHRSLSASAHIFVPLAMLGCLVIATLLSKIISQRITKLLLSVIVLALVWHYNYAPAHDLLKSSYNSPVVRINAAQIEASEWIRQNTDETQNVSVVGPTGAFSQVTGWKGEKVWWMSAFSHRVNHYFDAFLTWRTYANNREGIITGHLQNDLVMVDYSDIALISDRSFVESTQKFEQERLANHTLLYNKNNIRVYRYGG